MCVRVGIYMCIHVVLLGTCMYMCMHVLLRGTCISVCMHVAPGTCMCVCMNVEARDLQQDLSQWLSLLLFDTGSLTESEDHQLALLTGQMSSRDLSSSLVL